MKFSARDTFLNLVRLATIAVAVIAIVQELRKPPELREWHGTVGPVPYEFRKPTTERLRERLWAPDASLVQPQVFGVGWTLNLGRLLGSRSAK